jgi:hypothetical protein
MRTNGISINLTVGISELGIADEDEALEYVRERIL